MKTLIFHIGTYKTGSTSLQELLYNNRNELQSLYGICYPDLNAYTSLVPKAGNCMNMGESDASLEKTTDDIRVILEENDIAILSTENFWGYQIDKKERVINALLGLGVCLKVIVYIRRQDLYLDSLCNQLIKQDAQYLYDDSEGWQSGIRRWFNADYFEHLEAIERLIGKDNLIVRRFEPARFWGSDLYTDFFHSLELDVDVTKLNVPPRQNESLNNYMRELKRICNRVLKPYCARKIWPYEEEADLISAILSANDKQNCTEKSNFYTKQQRQDILEYYAEDNRRTSERYFDGEELFDNTIECNEQKTNLVSPEMIESIILVGTEVYWRMKTQMANRPDNTRRVVILERMMRQTWHKMNDIEGSPWEPTDEEAEYADAYKKYGSYQDLYDRMYVISSIGDIWNRIENHNVIIYGAGSIGRNVAEELSTGERIAKIKNIVVTSTPSAEVYCVGHKVCSIEDIVFDDDDRIIIATISEEYKWQMIDKCIELGVKDNQLVVLV